MLVEIIKLDKEDKDFVFYTYQFSLPGDEFKTTAGKIRYKLKVVSGSLKINKENGDVYTVKLAEGDSGSQARCASSVLIKHWLKGEYPDKACWAS
jgi:hypothetical protein